MRRYFPNIQGTETVPCKSIFGTDIIISGDSETKDDSKADSETKDDSKADSKEENCIRKLFFWQGMH